jgi:hypothetical protein
MRSSLLMFLAGTSVAITAIMVDHHRLPSHSPHFLFCSAAQLPLLPATRCQLHMTLYTGGDLKGTDRSCINCSMQPPGPGLQRLQPTGKPSSRRSSPQ